MGLAGVGFSVVVVFAVTGLAVAVEASVVSFLAIRLKESTFFSGRGGGHGFRVGGVTHGGVPLIGGCGA